MLRAFDLMYNGKMNGYICQGFNPLMSAPNKAKNLQALAKLKFLVVMDPLETETARFWENHGEFNDSNPAEIQTEVFELPTTTFAEDEGSLTNSSRWLQWHWPGQEPPYETTHDIDIMAELFLRIKALYQKEGGKFPDPILNLTWAYQTPDAPTAGRTGQGDQRPGARGRAPTHRPDQDHACRRASWWMASPQLTDDGKTSCACWIYSGCFTEQGNMMARRDTMRSGRCRDRAAMGLVMAGQPPHPV